MRKDKLLIFVCSILFFSCATDDYLSNDTLLSQKVENKAGALLMHQIQTQKGNKEQFVRALNGHSPLFNYVTVSSSGDYGLYYSVPYTNSANEVEGCIIYPVDTNLPMEQRRISGTLGTLVNMDREFLNGKVDLSTRYLYSAAFLNWQNNGLSVNSGLTAHAELLNSGPVTQNAQGVVSRSGPYNQECGKSVMVYIWYNLSSTAYNNGTDFGVTTLSPETVRRIFDGYLWSHSKGFDYQIDEIQDWHIELKMMFRDDHNAEQVINILRPIMEEIVKTIYGKNIIFQAESMKVLFLDSHTGSSSGGSGGSGYYGGGSGSTGASSGGNNNSKKPGIYKKSSLNDQQQKYLDEVISRVMNRCPFMHMKKVLEKGSLGFNDVQYDANLTASGHYDPMSKVYVVRDFESFPEEYIHMFQDLVYRGGISSFAKSTGCPNIDFEAKFLNDLSCFRNILHDDGSELCSCLSGSGESYKKEYEKWIQKLAEKEDKLTFDYIMVFSVSFEDPKTHKQIKLRYRDFLKDFRDSNKAYNYPIDESLRPMVLQDIYQNSSCY